MNQQKLLRYFLLLILISSTLMVSAKGGYKDIATGESFAMILKEDGTLWSMGANFFSQLGDETKTDRNTPLQILSNVKQVACGDYFTLALKEDGTLWGWGDKYTFGIGRYGFCIDATENASLPVQVMKNVKFVACNGSMALVILTDGTLWGWGGKISYKLGGTNTSSKHVPVKIADNVITAACGKYHFMYVKSDGSLWGMGDNDRGEIGDGTTTERYTPVKILDNVKEVSCGFGHTCAIKSDGSLWIWGCSLNIPQQYADHQLTPLKVDGNFRQISSGDNHTMAIKNDNSLWGWGSNQYNQLSDGTLKENKYGYMVKIAEDVKTVSCAPYFSLYITNSDELMLCGGITRKDREKYK